MGNKCDIYGVLKLTKRIENSIISNISMTLEKKEKYLSIAITDFEFRRSSEFENLALISEKVLH